MRTPEGSIVERPEIIKKVEEIWQNKDQMGEWEGTKMTALNYIHDNGRVERFGLVIGDERILPSGHGESLEWHVKTLEETIVYVRGMENES